MRILMASDLFHPFLLGGGEKRRYEVARRLAKKHEIHVLTRRSKGLPSYEVHEGVHIHRVFVPSAGIRLESLKKSKRFIEPHFCLNAFINLHRFVDELFPTMLAGELKVGVHIALEFPFL